MAPLGLVVVASIMAPGPVPRARRTSFALPGSWLVKAPLIGNATPDRFPMYTSLAVAVIAAVWVARARGPYGWVRWVPVLLGAVLLLPYIDGSSWYPYDRTPAFFTDGTSASVLNPDENVFVITETNGEEMLWQSAADFAFRMPEGYIGPIPDPYRRTRMSKGLGVEDAHPFEPSSTELSMWLQKNDVTAVGIGDSARLEKVVRRWLRQVYEGDGVSVWRMAFRPPPGARDDPNRWLSSRSRSPWWGRGRCMAPERDCRWHPPPVRPRARLLAVDANSPEAEHGRRKGHLERDGAFARASSSRDPVHRVASTDSGEGTSKGWTVRPIRVWGRTSSSLEDVSSDGAGGAWAVGVLIRSPAISRWNGATWTLAPVADPGPGLDALSGVAALTPRLAWAVGR